MPILPNAKYELFAQSLAKGETATKAYSDAGFSPSRRNAWRLKTRKDIAERVAEILGNAARSTEVTIQSIIQELDAAVDVARAKGQAQAMVSAASMKAKLTGLMIERSAISVTQEPSEFEQAQNAAEVLAKVEEFMGPEMAAKFAYLFDLEYEAPTPEQAEAVASVNQKMLEWTPPKKRSRQI